MAEIFSGPNFVNPAYATPEQLATQRAYAAELQKRSGDKVTHPAGALANALDALTAGILRNRADVVQQQAAQANAQDTTSLIAQLQAGKVDPRTLGTIMANPMISPETRAIANELIRPKGIEDVYGRPGYTSPATGVQAAPIQGQFTPGFRASEAAGAVSTTTPFPAPSGVIPRASVQPTAKVWGDKEAEAAGLYPPSGGGGQAPGAGLPTAPAPVASHLDQLAATDRRLSAEKERTQGGAKGEANIIESDIKRAATAPETLKGLGIMKNTIMSVGDKMTFGPTAKFSNEARRVISNYAPGLVDEKALAGADAIEKLNLGLAGALSSQLGLNPSDIYRSVASVPGNEKSKEGTLAPSC